MVNSNLQNPPSSSSDIVVDQAKVEMAAFPPPGEENSFSLDIFGLTVRHGSSLSITADVCNFLANPLENDTFNYIDPNADHHKWGRKGLSLYYACVEDNENDGSIICALRAATCNSSSNNIFLIDYVYTEPNHREIGIAGQLLARVLGMAKSSGAVLGVLSLEDSCVYWLEKWNFVLCQNEALNARLNVFPDTHLLIHRDCSLDSIFNGIENSTASSIPPEEFTACLNQLRLIGVSQPEGISEVQKTLAKLIQNATTDESEEGCRRIIRMNNKIIHERVFAIGGDAAMSLLQVCGWELGVNDDGDAVLKFAGEHKWLDAAIAQLEFEAKK